MATGTRGPGGPPPRPPRRGRRWTSFVAEPGTGSRRLRSLHEEANPAHRLRVEHDDFTLLLHLSGEEGHRGWTTVALDRPTRRWAVAQAPTQAEAAQQAYEALYSTE